jgi:tetratricopeptide (TPR) repeat protein
MIAQSYSDLNDSKNSLEAFYNAKSKISNESDYYINTLFNIGLLESLNGNYDNAEPVFIELIQIDPNDFHTYAKLIQIYYHRKEYDKAIPLKEKLYEAYLKGLLTDNMKDMYCFDQFKWKDKLVQAFERFEEGDKKEIYNKQLFYVVNQKEEIEIRIQTEYSPVSIALGGPKYLLCASKENVHFNSGIGFNDDFKYEDLKQAVIKMIESHLE